MTAERIVDRTAGWLGIAFLVLLLASEAALVLPDEHASAATVASFYAAHRAVIIGLQVAGFAGSALLALFGWRLRVIAPGVAAAGPVLAGTTPTAALLTDAVGGLPPPGLPPPAALLPPL